MNTDTILLIIAIVILTILLVLAIWGLIRYIQKRKQTELPKSDFSIKDENLFSTTRKINK